MEWTTPSTYEPNRDALAHLAAARRNAARHPCDANPCEDNNCKVHKHILAAAILTQVPAEETGEFSDRIAVQTTKRDRQTKEAAFKSRALGVSNVP